MPPNTHANDDPPMRNQCLMTWRPFDIFDWLAKFRVNAIEEFALTFHKRLANTVGPVIRITV